MERDPVSHPPLFMFRPIPYNKIMNSMITHRWRNLLILLLIPCISHCGTLGDRQEIVAIDSQPRGQIVYEQSESQTINPMGVTPFFQPLTPQSKQNLFIGTDPTTAQAVEAPCELNWRNAVIPDAALALGGVMVGIGALMIDLISGGIYTCGPRLLLKGVRKAPPLRPECHLYLIVPPQHQDHATSRLLARKWMNATKKRLGNCDAFIFNDQSLELLYSYNIRSNERHSFRDLTRRRWNKIALQTDATDIIFLDYYIENPQMIEFEPAVYDLFSGEESEASVHEVVSLNLDDKDRITPISWWRTKVHLIPNSILWSSQSLRTPFFNINNSEIKKSNRRDQQQLPEYLRKLSVDYIDHPRGFEDWDVNWTVSPSLRFLGESYSEFIEPGTSSPSDTNSLKIPYGHTYELEYYFLYGSLNLGVTFFTPFLEFGVNVGAGPAFLHAKDNIDLNVDRLLGGTQFTFNLRKFLGDTFYLQLDSTIFHPRGDTFTSKVEGHSNQYYLVSGSIGYYFTTFFKKE